MKVSLNVQPYMRGIEVFAYKYTNRATIVYKLQPVETQEYPPDQAIPKEWFLIVPPEDIIELQASLTEELTRHGFIKPHPSVEVEKELRARIDSLELIINGLIDASKVSVTHEIFKPEEKPE